MKLKDFAVDYVGRLPISDQTRKSYRHAITWACRYFGDDRDLSSITRRDFLEYLDYLLLRLASASAKRHAKRLRSILHEAVLRGVIFSNPGQGVNLYSPAVKAVPLVTIAETMRILDHCPTGDWLAMVALARFAGLRPVEVLELEWRHVQEDRLKVYNTRSGYRDVPLFAPLREVLDYVRSLPERSPTHVLSCSWDHPNLTTRLQRIIRKAGLTPIPRPCYAFALSRRRELLCEFPRDAVNEWLRYECRFPSGATDRDWNHALSMTCRYRPPVLPWA